MRLVLGFAPKKSPFHTQSQTLLIKFIIQKIIFSIYHIYFSMPGPSSPHLQLHPLHPLHQPQLLPAAPAARHAPLLLAWRPPCQCAGRGHQSPLAPAARHAPLLLARRPSRQSAGSGHQSPLAPAAGSLMERRQRRSAGESGGSGGLSAAAAASAPGDGPLVGRARLRSSRWVPVPVPHTVPTVPVPQHWFTPWTKYL